ncbi:MAG: CoA transferase [Actinobacteria bacterium]|nr:CoA transferase [Actinomycetota bacterium]
MSDGPLAGVRVVEFGSELADYAGLCLAGLGAEVTKVEPPQGSPSRAIGPFAADTPHPDRSLFFWAFNRGKRSVVLDLETDEGRSAFAEMVGQADVLLDASARGETSDPVATTAVLRTRFPHLVHARITPFGDDGPWADYKGSDLVHLALGGPLMCCGYDPQPSGRYDTAPMAPHAFQSLAIAGEQLVIGIIAALIARQRGGRGQFISESVHEAVSKSTEADLMSWVVERQPFYRQTCRHAQGAVANTTTIAHTKDGRWLNAVIVGARDRNRLADYLDRYGMAGELAASRLPEEDGARTIPGLGDSNVENIELIQRFVRRFTYAALPWKEMQEAGILCAPIRNPEENALDSHWLSRGTFTDVPHPELGRSLPYPTSKWIATGSAWQAGRRAPLLGEDTASALAEAPRPVIQVKEPDRGSPVRASKLGQPFALQDVKVFDFSWFLASAGGTRFLAALGADVVKVEWKTHPDTRSGGFPSGGRAARDAATAPLGASPGNLGPQFNNKNPGKRGISLNIGHPKGKEMAREFVAWADVVAEGFSPGVFERWGFGWHDLCAINPTVIYAQQSGMGQRGEYGRFRAIGPIAAALSGLTAQGGLPEPALPTGWGYSYLDWLGAYSFATAILSSLYQRDRTGQPQWVDASQCEVGIFTTGVTVLDWAVNGRSWQRPGNHSVYRPASPEGVYRCAGEDRWLAITCATDAEWRSLAAVAGHPEWLEDSRLATGAERISHRQVVDTLVESWTITQDRYAAMTALQRAGVAAGVAQTAEDRCDSDPQLAHAQWLTEVPNGELGSWPLAELPFDMSQTPAYVGGAINKGAPAYGEHNYEVYAEVLGLSVGEVDALAEEGVI